jgi:hypothetical protein
MTFQKELLICWSKGGFHSVGQKGWGFYEYQFGLFSKNFLFFPTE